MKTIFVGIDNGVSGSIGIVGTPSSVFMLTPVFKEQDYQKTSPKKVSRLNHKALENFIFNNTFEHASADEIQILLERPMVMPGRFKASASALRCHEATLIAIENMGLAYDYIDSKEWQKALLPIGVKGSAELKKASFDVGSRLFPSLAHLFADDADGILIAEYCRRKYGK